MMYPKLVPCRLCSANVIVTFKGDMDIRGKEQTIEQFKGTCNLSLKTTQIMTAEKKLVTTIATALFDGDIAPYINNIKGELELKELFPIYTENFERLETEQGEVLDFFTFKGKKFNIYRASKEKNPDGTVNYTRLELA